MLISDFLQSLKLNKVKTGDLVIYGVLLVIGVVTLYVRFRYLDMPFERDEGEYAYGAQLLLQGEGLYDNVYSLKWPGIFWSYALVLLMFGQTVWGVHLGVLILNVFTAFIVYQTARCLVSRLPAVIGALTYLLFTVQRELQGIIANSERFVIFYFCISLLLIFKYQSQLKLKFLFWVGIFSSFAFLNKQHAIGYILATYCILFFFEMERGTLKTAVKPIVVYSASLMLPFIIALFWVFGFDNFDSFWFHTVTYAREYVVLTSFDEAWNELSKRITENLAINPILWGGFFLSIIFVLMLSSTKQHRKILYPLLVGGIIATSLGFYFRPHYFMFMALPGALFLAVVFECISSNISKAVTTVIFVISSLSYFIIEKEYLFEWDGNWTNYQIFYRYPFREAKIVGDYLKDKSQPGDRILVIGSEPEINFYAQRRSVTGYIYSYPFFEDQPFAEEMSKEWMEEINSDHPEYIVLMGHWKTYVSREHPMFKEIRDFSESFISENGYQIIGEVDLPIQDGGMAWGESAINKKTRPENWIEVYRK